MLLNSITKIGVMQCFLQFPLLVLPTKRGVVTGCQPTLARRHKRARRSGIRQNLATKELSVPDVRNPEKYKTYLGPGH